MTTTAIGNNPKPEDSTNGIELFIGCEEYNVLLWLIIEQHKIPTMRRNEKHLRLFDAIAAIQSWCNTLFVLKLDLDLIPPLYTTLTILESEGIERMIRHNCPLATLQKTHMSIHALMSAIEPYYLDAIYKEGSSASEQN